MPDNRQPHILNAASNLLGICFVLIAGLKLSGASDHTLADEISMASALGFMLSCILSFVSMRAGRFDYRYERIADYIFIASMICLFVAVSIFAKNLL